jgi:hypothetical protein
VINQSRFSARGLLDAITGCGVTTSRAAHGVADADHRASAD